MRPFNYVKSAVGRLERKETRLSEEFEDKDGEEIVDIVTEKSSLDE